MASDNDGVLFHFKSSVKVGELERYVVKYQLYEGDQIPSDLQLDSLWLCIKNMEALSYRAAYLMGPFILYCDVRTDEYHHSQKIVSSADQPQFESNLQAQQKLVAELPVHQIKPQYTWIIDVVSQAIFTTSTQTTFEVTIGSSKESVQRYNNNVLSLGTQSPRLNVTRLTTLDIWNLPATLPVGKEKKPGKHLVVLTHGLHSNVTADMCYIMEQIYNSPEAKSSDKEKIVVRGFTGNICETEKGIKYLGTRLANYIINELYDDTIRKISFIGHSLGGLVQTFAIAYIAIKYPDFFQKVRPVNFVAIASPMLGIVTDNPAYINFLLSFGVIGKTGQDLNLEADTKNDKPLIYLLSDEYVRAVLGKFQKRTLYANVINDGIVPLYTSSLLFLDYENILEKLQTLSHSNSKNVPHDEAAMLINERTSLAGSSNNYLKKSLVSPITKMLSIIAPQRIDAKTTDKIPKVSFLESATSILIPPLPTKAYILDPRSRASAIIHDKVYTENDVPPKNSVKNEHDNTSVLLKAFSMTLRKQEEKLEETIARRWHKGLSWRKVIVALKPDAHNNIIVRRRFANAYGWPVIDHLISCHFNAEKDTDEQDSMIDNLPSTIDTAEEPNKKYAWLTKIDTPSVFDEGPTGMISTVGDMIETFTKNKLSTGSNITTTTTVTNTTRRKRSNASTSSSITHAQRVQNPDTEHTDATFFP